MENADNRSTARVADRCVAAEARPRTVLEEINAAIEQHNRAIADLIRLRDSTPVTLLAMSQPLIARLAWPNQPF